MQNVSIKGFIYAALSSATFGLAPFFTISLLLAGFSSFEVLAYRWGIASLTLVVFGIMLGETFRISRKDWGTVFILSLLRAATSFSLVIAYQNISSGVASTIPFMYPLAVALDVYKRQEYTGLALFRSPSGVYAQRLRLELLCHNVSCFKSCLSIIA